MHPPQFAPLPVHEIIESTDCPQENRREQRHERRERLSEGQELGGRGLRALRQRHHDGVGLGQRERRQRFHVGPGKWR